MNKYCKLFSISVGHEYFNYGVDPSIGIEPSVTSLRVIEKYGFLIQLEQSTITLYSNQEKDIPEYLNYIAQLMETEAFEFTLQLHSDSFYCYTQLAKNTKLSFSDTYGENLVQGSTIQLFGREEPSKGIPSFVVSISFEGISTAYPKEFEIKLNSRKTRRDYYLINSSEINVENISIEGATFLKETITTLPNGQQAIPFIMQGDPIPLKQKDDFQFNLIETSGTVGPNDLNNRKRILYKVLPQPDPCNLKMIEAEGKVQFISPVYVYI